MLHPREMERGVAGRCAGEGHGASAGGFEVLVSKNLTLLRSADPSQHLFEDFHSSPRKNTHTHKYYEIKSSENRSFCFIFGFFNYF